jgi:phage FluMu protein Com
MNCPDCGAELQGEGNIYTCDYCKVRYEATFYCEKCGKVPEMESSPGHFSFFCPDCKESKHEHLIKKELKKLGPVTSSAFTAYRHTDGGYRQLIRNGTWKLGILNYTDEFSKKGLQGLYRYEHAEAAYTVLSEGGSAYIVFGGSEERPEQFEAFVMQPQTVYKVEPNVWHTVILQDSGSVIEFNAVNGGESSYQFFLLEDEERRELHTCIHNFEKENSVSGYCST